MIKIKFQVFGCPDVLEHSFTEEQAAYFWLSKNRKELAFCKVERILH